MACARAHSFISRIRLSKRRFLTSVCYQQDIDGRLSRGHNWRVQRHGFKHHPPNNHHLPRRREFLRRRRRYPYRCQRASAPVQRYPPAYGLRDNDFELSDERDEHLDPIVYAECDGWRDVWEQHSEGVADTGGTVVDEQPGCAVWEVGRGVRAFGCVGVGVRGISGRCILGW